MDISHCRQRLRQLSEEQESLLPILFGRKPLVKGGVYQTRTKCGKKGCKCEREGELHVVWRFYRSREGKTEIRSLKGEDIVRYKRLTENYRMFRCARARWVKIQRRQIELINFLEEGMTEKDL